MLCTKMIEKVNPKHIQFMEENGFVLHETSIAPLFAKQSQVKNKPIRISIEKPAYLKQNTICIFKTTKQININIFVLDFENLEYIVNNFLDYVICNFQTIESKINLQYDYEKRFTGRFYILTKPNGISDIEPEFLIRTDKKQRECILISKETVRKYMNVEYIMLMQKLYAFYEVKEFEALSKNINGRMVKTLNKINEINKQ